MTTPRPVEELSYQEAIGELEAILDRLEHDDPDVDRVALDVARAAALVVHCRSRIDDARLQVEEVVADLRGAPDDAVGPAPTADDGDGPADGGPGA